MLTFNAFEASWPSSVPGADLPELGTGPGASDSAQIQKMDMAQAANVLNNTV